MNVRLLTIAACTTMIVPVFGEEVIQVLPAAPVPAAVSSAVTKTEGEVMKADDPDWGDIAAVEVKGITFGMTRQEVQKKLGDVQAPKIVSGLPQVIKCYPDANNVEQKLTIYFGVLGPCSNKVVAIESMFNKAAMTDRKLIVETLQEKYGFEDDYLEHKSVESTKRLKDDYESLPQYTQKLNDRVDITLRIDWDNKKQRNYLITVTYAHSFYGISLDLVRQGKPSTEEEKRRDVVREFL